jgi:hypothetical protein
MLSLVLLESFILTASPCKTICRDLEEGLAACDASAPATCDKFLAAGEKYMQDALCGGVDFDGCGERHIDAGDYLRALAAISQVNPHSPAERRRALRALTLEGNSSKVLDGGLGEDWNDAVAWARTHAAEGVLSDEELWKKRISLAPARQARASSVLAPQGRHRYDPANALDGSEDTAWCSAHRSNGVGEWIEVSTDPKADSFTGISLIPGYGRDPATFSRNNRVVELLVADCAEPEQAFAVDLRTLDLGMGEEPATDVTLRPYSFDVRPARCVRITVKEVVPGLDKDTCLSEIVPYLTHHR